MSVQTMQYARKPFVIDAVRVTAENIEEVAEWCEGEVRTKKDASKYIKVAVQRPMNDRQTMAFAGDWVLKAGMGFKVYTQKAFEASFEPYNVKTLENSKGKMVEISAGLV